MRYCFSAMGFFTSPEAMRYCIRTFFLFIAVIVLNIAKIEAVASSLQTVGSATSNILSVNNTPPLQNLAQGYNPRACGLDLDDDGIWGEPLDDCQICDATVESGNIVAGTTDPDNDGIHEDIIYIDCQNGIDQVNCGTPGNPPCKSIDYAWNTQGDGPAGEKEDILCFTGVCRPKAVIVDNSGASGIRTKTQSDNEERDFEFPANPTMLLSWDTDQDGQFAPFDADETAILDGSTFTIEPDENGSSSVLAFRFGGGNGRIELAHFEVQNYNPDEPDPNDPDPPVGPGDVRSGFVRFGAMGQEHTSHISFHDLELRNINTERGGGNRIIFNFFSSPDIFHYLSFANIDISDISGFLSRGGEVALPGDGEEEFGPLRWQNMNVTVHSFDPIIDGNGQEQNGGLQGWKLWGHISRIEILDNIFDGNVANWDAGTGIGNSGSLIMVDPNFCSRDITIRNNLIYDFQKALNITADELCTQNRTIDDIVFDRNIFLNRYTDWQGLSGVQIKGDGGTTVEDVTITNNIFATSGAPFSYCMQARIDDAQGGQVTFANNTCYGPLNDNEEALLLIGKQSTQTMQNPQTRFLIQNNILGGLNNGDALIKIKDAEVRPDQNPDFLQDFNVLDPSGTLFDSPIGPNSRQCLPEFIDIIGQDFHLLPNDICARNLGTDLSEFTTADVDGDSRPQDVHWDIGADETAPLPPSEPPLRFDGAPQGTFPAGTSQVTLSLTTDESATCRSSQTPGTLYTDMPVNTEFSSTNGSTRHTRNLTGLSSGQSFTYFIRCIDDLGNANDDDFLIQFSIAQSGLVAHWTLDETSGCTAHDIVGSNDGILQPGCPTNPNNIPEWVPGNIGGALDFDGFDDRLIIDPATALPSGTTPRTLSLWFRKERCRNNAETLGGFGNNVLGGNFQLEVCRNGNFSVLGWGAAFDWDTGVSSEPYINNTNTWHHAAVTYDGTTTIVYVDGNELARTSDFTWDTDPARAIFGEEIDGNGHPAEGSIDDIRIYDRALNATEIMNLASAAPARSNLQPQGSLPAQTTTVKLALQTNENATCRYAESAGTSYNDMTETFDVTGGTVHEQPIFGLQNSDIKHFYVRCASTNANTNDAEIHFEILPAVTPDFSPADLNDAVFYIESSSFTNPQVVARTIATCNTTGIDSCFEKTMDDSLPTPIADQYCDTDVFPNGCVRRWDDLSGFCPEPLNQQGECPAGAFDISVDNPFGEWIKGRDFGQDDIEKPGLILNCLNGLPCVRGGLSSDSIHWNQNLSHEVEIRHAFGISNDFSIFHLARPIAQNEDYFAYGLDGLQLNVVDNSLSHRIGGITTLISNEGAFVNDLWQLFEIHRIDGNIQVLVNGIDVTANAPQSVLDLVLGQVLSQDKGNLPMLGDLVSHLVYDRSLSIIERQQIRGYFDGIYTYLPEISGQNDSTPPVRSDGLPSGQLGAGTTQTTLSLRTDEGAICRYSETANTDYEEMEETFASDQDSRFHTAEVSQLMNGQSYAFYVRCQDQSENANPDDFPIQFSIENAPPMDTTPPVRSNGLPSGELDSGTTLVDLSVTTNEDATCRYSDVANTVYSAMTQTFTSGDSRVHTARVDQLEDGESYAFYVRCQDQSENANPDDFPIQFSIENVPPTDTTPPVRSNGLPSGELDSGTTQTTLSLRTDEDAICRYSETANTTYADMTKMFTSGDSRFHTAGVSQLMDGQSYAFYVRCQDQSDNLNVNLDDFPIQFSIANAPPDDMTPPVRSDGLPSGQLGAGTTQTTLSLRTDEDAICRYSEMANMDYEEMEETFASGDSRVHTAGVSQLMNGQSYAFYVRCQDQSDNLNTNGNDFRIQFSVATNTPPPPPQNRGDIPIGALQLLLSDNVPPP